MGEHMRDDATAPADEFSTPAPDLTLAEAEDLAERLFGVRGVARALNSERDQNFSITDVEGHGFVLKVANPGEDHAIAEMQVEALLHVARTDPTLPVPRVRRALNGAPIAATQGRAGKTYSVRMVTFLKGVTKGRHEFGAPALRSLGECGARLGQALLGFSHPAAVRTLIWDLQRTATLAPLLPRVKDNARRAIALRVIDRFRQRVAPALPGLRAQVIHNDVHADNVVLGADSGSLVTGIIDFGDLVYAPLVCDLAVTTASILYPPKDPFDAAAAVIEGYTSVTPLQESEIELLPDLVTARFAAWVLIAAWRAEQHPENVDYIVAWTEETWEALELFERFGTAEVSRRFREICERHSAPSVDGTKRLLARRRRALGPTLPLSYERPLHIVRGEGVWLYDAEGRAYLDAYNNVPVVGHSHPKVADALSKQTRLLNTNTRYLHEAVIELAERLAATMPRGLDTCLFVNSGSEANDTAWRLAREATGNGGAIVTEFAYHGVTIATADLSPQEWPKGRHPASVGTIPSPDGYRGRYRHEEAGWLARYAAHVDDAVAFLRSGGFEPAICCIDSAFTSDGIFRPAPAYLAEVVERTRAAGGLFVADEVQAGFGRTGERLWGFEASGITPDFVTLGKPMGNGHPVAAVLTRAEIAAAFAERYPEFFSTFGGNTVAAVVALTVLEVIREEGLQQNAAEVGAYVREGLQDLAMRHECIGEVRGEGLMIGVELVRNRETREPASRETSALCNAMRDRGVLIGTAGSHQSVLKIRPPLVFSRMHADQLIQALDEAFAECEERSGGAPR
jgi:4-aminobutyrate aminotransferase-like enzyme/Ser/Thr protein kinase RdoA (MazF antagonist)